MSGIIWPERFTPGTTDNFVSNEIIVPGIYADEVWDCLTDTAKWPSYYGNVSDIRFHDGKGPVLREGSRFRFTTFGLPIDAKITEYEAPVDNRPARIAWHGWMDAAPGREKVLDVHHAWLFEDLPGDRVRILTQESQLGEKARELAATLPNPMLNAHQDWLDGLARATLSDAAGRCRKAAGL